MGLVLTEMLKFGGNLALLAELGLDKLPVWRMRNEADCSGPSSAIQVFLCNECHGDLPRAGQQSALPLFTPELPSSACHKSEPFLSYISIAQKCKGTLIQRSAEVGLAC